jgi:glucose-fructose oxidoreductase
MKKIRYAVAGLGHIAQAAVLPAFKHVLEKCELTAFISDDSEKIKKLSKQYNVPNAWSYDEYDAALASGTFDAVYITLPNDMHKDFTMQAAKSGIHILCEKPMAVTSKDCSLMIEAAQKHSVKLMIAYRLHFEKTNMTAVDLIDQGKIGKPRIFNSTFTMQVREGNIRTQSEHGGGPLNDIGIYCINAARYLFKEEPLEVTAIGAQSSDSRFAEIEESVSAVLKFPGEKLASFSCSFGAVDMGRFEVVGTEGSISLDPAYEYAQELEYVLKIGDKTQHHKTPKHDQFAPELLHFAECILEDKDPRPSGFEGLNDLKVIEAIRESAQTGKAIRISPNPVASKPDKNLIKEKPGVPKPSLVKAKSGSK